MLNLKRIPDWRQRLNTIIHDRRYVEFEWGVHDCAQMAFAAIEAVTGKDISEATLGTYTTPEGGYKALRRKFDTDSLKQLFKTRFDEAHIAYARPGDIVYQASNMFGYDVVLGVCQGQYSFFIQEDEGLIELPTMSQTGCFRIG